MKKAWTLTTDITEVVSIAGRFESVAHYQNECDVISKIHLIKKPFFFMSALDDPFFG